MQTLHMRKEYHTRLQRGHLWGWRNDFDPAELEGFSPGEPCRLLSSDGDLVGVGFANPLSHISFRLVSAREEPIGPELWRRRLDQALAWRERVRRDTRVRRLVYGESDGLPGLIADQYGDVLVLSQTVAGMEPWTGFFLEEFARRIAPRVIILRNANMMRRLEGLPLDVTVASGAWDGPVTVECDGAEVLVDCLTGRKTGLFLDHRENRRLLGRLLNGGEAVLDLFSHCGLWSLAALTAGAGPATCVDSDPEAVALGRASADANGWAARTDFRQEDVGAFLETSTRLFDVVVLDPPAFVKKKRYLKDGLELYGRMNCLALARVAPGGLFVTSSCSSFVSTQDLDRLVQDACRANGARLQRVATGHQALDHPVLAAMPETEYLTCLYYRKIEG